MQHTYPRRLLIISQRIDRNDSVLGFFHRWLEEFAKQLAGASAICLYEGEHEFGSEKRNPSTRLRAGTKNEKYANVTVYSLGKERGYSKLRQLFRFWRFCWHLAPQVDGVFVHMNAIWVVLGWPIFALHRKKVVFWIAHYKMSWLANLAGLLADAVVTSTTFGARLKTKKPLVVGQGIDTEMFRRLPDIRRDEKKLLVLGRISRMKNVDVILRAFAETRKHHADITLDVVGEPVYEDDYQYYEELKTLAKNLGADGAVSFLPRVPYIETVSWYNSHGVFLNATESGSFDKTMPEAMACQLPALVSNRPFEAYFSPRLRELLLFRERDAEGFAEKLTRFLSLPASEKEAVGREVREIVVRLHSVSQLIRRIIGAFQGT